MGFLFFLMNFSPETYGSIIFPSLTAGYLMTYNNFYFTFQRTVIILKNVKESITLNHKFKDCAFLLSRLFLRISAENKRKTREGSRKEERMLLTKGRAAGQPLAGANTRSPLQTGSPTQNETTPPLRAALHPDAPRALRCPIDSGHRTRTP